MNLRKTANMLQTALAQQGRFININQYQSYSAHAERMVTKYVLTEKRKESSGKEKSFVIIETYKIADVVKKLAAIYGGENADT